MGRLLFLLGNTPISVVRVSTCPAGTFARVPTQRYPVAVSGTDETDRLGLKGKKGQKRDNKSGCGLPGTGSSS